MVCIYCAVPALYCAVPTEHLIVMKLIFIFNVVCFLLGNSPAPEFYTSLPSTACSSTRIPPHSVILLPIGSRYFRAKSFPVQIPQHSQPQYGNSADTYADRGSIPSPDAKAKGGREQQASRGHRPRLNESRSALIRRALSSYPE